ncbi:helix-turn-helix domain-containing protein [Pusillimonas sp. ANT_WB101]|uniref:helix-turn-helix domain-containing protein n=1 Tax=Pusillimonas sp. ANT_WB101 TaxID=2597356 RepID=UPI0021032875|nr:helix-turn-helix domain-containing protein [Pusillimonas sp. ANT_WB101]
MVFDRYHAGGGEMLLALAIADHSNDQGGDIFPSIKMLAEKTRQSERTVQYQLRRMEESGWLILVNSGNGGRNQRREYIISPDWMKGANIAPLEKGAIHDTKGATDDTKGCNPQQERVQPVAPAYNRHRTIKEPSYNHQACETPQLSVGFDDFWNAYPNTSRRVAKSKCRDLWKAKKLDAVADEILSHVKTLAATKQWLDGYEPAPLTYLNQKRWEDGVPVNPAATGASKHANFGKQDYRAGVAADGSF